MTKEFTSIVTVEFAYNNRVAESKEEYIELLKEQYRDDYNIELSNSEITNIEEVEEWVTITKFGLSLGVTTGWK